SQFTAWLQDVISSSELGIIAIELSIQSPELLPRAWSRARTRRWRRSAYVEHVNSAAIGGGGKLPASSVKGEPANNHASGYAFAHISPRHATIGAGKNSGIRSYEDMLRVSRIDGQIAID